MTTEAARAAEAPAYMARRIVGYGTRCGAVRCGAVGCGGGSNRRRKGSDQMDGCVNAKKKSVKKNG